MKTAQERTVTALRTDILSGALSPGARVVQEDIAERYGVSRVPLREALQLLTSEGLVSHHPNRGYFVTELSIEDLLEVYHLRRILEEEAIRQAVPALSDDDVSHLRALAAAVEDAAEARDVNLLTEANRRFHFALFEAAGMPRLTRLLRQLWDASDVYRALYFQQGVNRARVNAEHEEMLQSLADRDVDLVVQQHNAHRDHSVAWVSTHLRREHFAQSS